MRVADLPEVEAAERVVYAHPWTLGNFKDSISSGYECWIARDTAGTLIGYFLLMLAPDEAHLLNITLVPALQGRGLGRRLLDQVCLIARRHAAAAVLLEVRPSNPHALSVYRHVGFRQIGIRKGYYPAADERREDAIVMRLDL
jgi:ribosomal-protein-alanine N-acetyltransferase